MATLVSKLTDVQARLDALAKQHKVPGASLGILDGNGMLEFATGVLNLNTDVPVTPQSLFQIGSNTKIYTTTLVMQLVDEGKVSLDAPVKRYVPELELGDVKAADAITVRMLLTHSSGIEGDYFDDYGRGDDGLERYIGSLAQIGNVYPPGDRFSYCNSGFCLAGRVVEKVTGDPYHKVLREKLLTPLRCAATTVLMEEMLGHSCAVGHNIGAKGPEVVPQVMMSPSQAPAGSMTASTPREVLRFVKMHIDEGRSQGGDQVLSAASVAAMQQPQVKLPRSVLAGNVGLGWMLSEWSGERVLAHGGGTFGQLSFLYLLPDRPFAVVLLTNAMSGGALWESLGRWIFEEMAGIELPRAPKPPKKAPRVDLKKYVGSYNRLGIDTEVALEDGKLVAKMKGTGSMASFVGEQTAKLTPIDAELFATAEGGLAQFSDLDRSGRPAYLWFGSRVARRSADKPGAKTGKRKPAAKRKKPAAKRKTSSAKRKTAARRKPAARRKKPRASR